MLTLSKTIFVFFTWDISLALWKEKGLLEREVKYYQAIAEKGYKIIFLTWGGRQDESIADGLHENIKVLPVYNHLPKPEKKILRFLLSPFSLWVARHSLSSSDLLKTNQMWGAWCAVLAKFFFRKPLLVRTGFELYKFTIAQEHHFLRRFFIFLISKITYASADIIYVATEGDKHFVQKRFKIASTRIEVRPNWIDTSKFSPPSTARKDREILFVGRLTEQKNLPLIIKAIEGSQWALNIVGSGELEEEIKSLVKRKNVCVNFLETVANDELPSFYGQCTVFVLPSFYEGNPKTLLEAMACGCAVIGTNVEGINNVIQDGMNGLLCDLTSESLHDSIDTLMGNSELRKTLGEAARRQIQSTQTLDIMTKKEMQDYETKTLPSK